MTCVFWGLEEKGKSEATWKKMVMKLGSLLNVKEIMPSETSKRERKQKMQLL